MFTRHPSYISREELEKRGLSKLVQQADARMAALAAGTDNRPVTTKEIQGHLDDFALAKEFSVYGKIGGLSGGQKVIGVENLLLIAAAAAAVCCERHRCFRCSLRVQLLLLLLLVGACCPCRCCYFCCCCLCLFSMLACLARSFVSPGLIPPARIPLSFVPTTPPPFLLFFSSTRLS